MGAALQKTWHGAAQFYAWTFRAINVRGYRVKDELPHIGHYRANYAPLTEEEAAARDAEGEELMARSKVLFERSL